MSGQKFYKRLKQIVAGDELDVQMKPSRMSKGAGYEGNFTVSDRPVEEFAEDVNRRDVAGTSALVEEPETEAVTWWSQ